MTEYIWFAVVFGGPVLLAILFLYGRNHTLRHPRDPDLKRRQVEGTRRGYEQRDRE